MGIEIAWANGTKWEEPRLGGSWTYGSATQVYEGTLPGMTFGLTFINEHGRVSAGILDSCSVGITTLASVTASTGAAS